MSGPSDNSEDYEDYLPSFQLRSILNLPTNKERLDKVEECLTKAKQSLPATNAPPQRAASTNKCKSYQYIIDKFSNRDNINFTIPEPFSFMQRTAKTRAMQAKSLEKVKTILEQRDQHENSSINNKQFKANHFKSEMFIGNINNLIEADKRERARRCLKRGERIQMEMKPFSFVEKDERKQKEKQQRIKDYENAKLEFPQFKANPVKWTTKTYMLDNITKKQASERRQRIERRAKETYEKSKLPPRLEMHEKEKKEKQRKQAIAAKRKANEERKKKKFDPEIKIPNYKEMQHKFEQKIQDDKNKRPKTVVQPFSFDKNSKHNCESNNVIINSGNDYSKNVHLKKNMLQMMKKLQKGSGEGAQTNTTKTMKLLMEQKRREQEDKKKHEQQRLIADNERKKEQQKLSRKIHQNERLKDKTKDDIVKQQESNRKFQRELKEMEGEKRKVMEIAKQRIYNKKFMFEDTDVGGESDFMKKLRMKQLIEEAIEDGEEEQEENEDEDEEIQRNGGNKRACKGKKANEEIIPKEENEDNEDDMEYNEENEDNEDEMEYNEIGGEEVENEHENEDDEEIYSNHAKGKKQNNKINSQEIRNTEDNNGDENENEAEQDNNYEEEDNNYEEEEQQQDGNYEEEEVEQSNHHEEAEAEEILNYEEEEEQDINYEEEVEQDIEMNNNSEEAEN